jgi:hypothetical protein
MRLFALTLITLFNVCMATACCADDVFTNPADPKLPPDFRIQGEYAGKSDAGDFGCQVIALGNGAFQAVIYPGGLPGAGWDGKRKSLMDGELEGETATFKPAEGNRSYLANSPEQFSATSKFPPEGHEPFTGKIAKEMLTLTTTNGAALELAKVERKSPSLGKEPPEGALVLFDGTTESMQHWRGGRLDEATKLLNTDGSDIVTQQKFNNYTMHLEFMLPYRPEARGQGRGNSGFYQVDHYEMQILDSFGLEGKDNECGGIYSKQPSLVNACLPPLMWQTYDVDFTNAVRDESGKKTANAKITAKLNGITIHDGYEIPDVTGGSRSEPEGTPGPIKLQGHGNPLQFRNVWIVEKK